MRRAALAGGTGSGRADVCGAFRIQQRFDERPRPRDSKPGHKGRVTIRSFPSGHQAGRPLPAPQGEGSAPDRGLPSPYPCNPRADINSGLVFSTDAKRRHWLPVYGCPLCGTEWEFAARAPMSVLTESTNSDFCTGRRDRTATSILLRRFRSLRLHGTPRHVNGLAAPVAVEVNVLVDPEFLNHPLRNVAGRFTGAADNLNGSTPEGHIRLDVAIAFIAIGIYAVNCLPVL